MNAAKKIAGGKSMRTRLQSFSRRTTAAASAIESYGAAYSKASYGSTCPGQTITPRVPGKNASANPSNKSISPAAAMSILRLRLMSLMGESKAGNGARPLHFFNASFLAMRSSITRG